MLGRILALWFRYKDSLRRRNAVNEIIDHRETRFYYLKFASARMVRPHSKGAILKSVLKAID